MPRWPGSRVVGARIIVWLNQGDYDDEPDTWRGRGTKVNSNGGNGHKRPVKVGEQYRRSDDDF